MREAVTLHERLTASDIKIIGKWKYLSKSKVSYSNIITKLKLNNT